MKRGRRVHEGHERLADAMRWVERDGFDALLLKVRERRHRARPAHAASLGTFFGGISEGISSHVCVCVWKHGEGRGGG